MFKYSIKNGNLQELFAKGFSFKVCGKQAKLPRSITLNSDSTGDVSKGKFCRRGAMLKYVTKHLQIGTDKHADGKPQARNTIILKKTFKMFHRLYMSFLFTSKSRFASDGLGAIL